MNCKRCGKPSDGSWCAQCLDEFETTQNLGAIYRPSAPTDPYLVSESESGANQSLPQPLAWDPYSAPVSAVAVEERPKRPVGLVLTLVAALMLVLIGGTYLMLGSSMTSQSAAPQAELATGGAPAAKESAEDTQSEADEILDEATAVAGVEYYFSIVAGNPTEGWPLLSRARQDVENKTSYIEFWSSVTSAAVYACIYDDTVQSVTCTLKLVKDGKETSTTVTLYVVLEDGVVKIDKKRS